MSCPPKPRLLIVDDDSRLAEAVAGLGTEAGYDCALSSGARALDIAREVVPDAVVAETGGPAGVDVLPALKRFDPRLPVVVHTAYPDVTAAVEAIRAGAAHYLEKPASWPLLRQTLERAMRKRALEAADEARGSELRERLGLGYGRIVGESDAMRAIYDQVRRVASSRATALITGESGTGKGELARTIHERGPRSDGPFVTLHCASLPSTLVESELFGHERGSFTGALVRRVGRFEQAQGGTLFIDEVGDIPPATQTKLLRVLQERVFERVGGDEPVSLDARLIAATNRDLTAEIRAGRFREDLYYRLNVIHLRLPPLGERGDDVALLATYLLHRHRIANDAEACDFSPAALAALCDHPWHGNVRELENTIERAVVMCRGRLIEPEDLEPVARAGVDVPIPGATLAEIEHHAILASLEATCGSARRTAEMLGLSLRTVQCRLRQWGMARPRGRPRSRPVDDALQLL